MEKNQKEKSVIRSFRDFKNYSADFSYKTLLIRSVFFCLIQIYQTYLKPHFYVEPAPEPVKAPRKEVGIADQIAIRSFVLSKSLGKVGGKVF